MLISDLRPNQGARRNRKRVGRGRASGHGKTSTRGHNGQGQRSGESKRFGFEGGQTPLFRRLPKVHNFNQVTKREWVFINVGDLSHLPANSEVTAETLLNANVISKATDSLRILGNGELKVALKVKVHHVTAGAKAKIEAAGGTVEVIVVEPTKGKRAKRIPRSIAKKAQEVKDIEKEKAAMVQAKAEKAEKGAAKKAAPAKSDKGGGGQPKGGGQQKGGGDKKPQQKQDKKK